MSANQKKRPGDNIRHNLTYEDLRGWLGEAERLGELRHVSGASWEREIGLAASVISRSETADAVLFDEVPGFAKGFRVLTNIFGGRRKNMSLGFPTDLGKVELSDAFADVFSDTAPLIPPAYVDDGPIFENVMTGEDVDLEIFPTPFWHEKDGGRYIGTGSYNVTRDPDTGWINCGCYRLMIMDKKTVGHNVVPGHHASVHLRKYQERGERMPMVMVLGGDPMTFFMGSSVVPEGIGEMDVVGRMRGKPIEVVKGPITGLPIPANAEIAMEGYVNLERIEPEGPFGDWTGTYTEKGRVDPVVDIQAIYHRNDPILLGFVPQALPDEFSRFFAITRSALLKRSIEAAGVPDVKAVWAHEIGGARILFGVAITQRYAGHSKQAGHVASMCGANNGNRWVIVTDDDIDVVDLEELIYAALTRSDPATSVDLIRGAQGSKADPRLTPWDRASGNHVNSRLIFDACRPFHWRGEVPEPTKPSAETSAAARAKFGYLLED